MGNGSGFYPQTAPNLTNIFSNLSGNNLVGQAMSQNAFSLCQVGFDKHLFDVSCFIGFDYHFPQLWWYSVVLVKSGNPR